MSLSLPTYATLSTKHYPGRHRHALRGDGATAGMSFESVLGEVRDRVVPDDDERAALESVVEDLTGRAEAAIEEIGRASCRERV